MANPAHRDKSGRFQLRVACQTGNRLDRFGHLRCGQNPLATLESCFYA